MYEIAVDATRQYADASKRADFGMSIATLSGESLARRSRARFRIASDDGDQSARRRASRLRRTAGATARLTASEGVSRRAERVLGVGTVTA
jgi:hypothetical protein